MLTPTNFKIFILDTDRLYAKAIVRFFHTYPDFEFTTFTSFERCLNSFYLEPDIIIMSDALEGLNSCDIIPLIKNKLPRAEIIMTSVDNKIEVVKNCLRYGAYDFIIKNGKSLTLIEMAINSILSGKSVHQPSEFPI